MELSSCFQSLQSLSLVSKDGLPTVASSCLLPSPIENTLALACSCFDGSVRIVQFNDQTPSQTSNSHHNMNEDSMISNPHSTPDSLTRNPVDIITIGRDNYPVLAVSSLARDDLVCLAFGGLGRQIQLSIRSSTSYPVFQPLMTLDTSSPVSCIKLQTISYVKREETAWDIRVYYGCQDKAIHMVSVSAALTTEGKVKVCKQFNKIMFIGHNSYVRAMSLLEMDTSALISVGDDFAMRHWPLNLLQSEKITRCTLYEGHEDDVIAVDSKKGWVITGSKDKSVGFWDFNPAKTSRAEKSRETKIDRLFVNSVVKSVLLSDDATMAFVGCGDGTIKTIQRNLNDSSTSSSFTIPAHAIASSTTSQWSIISSHTLVEASIDNIIFTQNVLVTSSLDLERSLTIWKIPTE